MVVHQTVRLSIGGANDIFGFYELPEVVTYTTDLCRQNRISGIKSLIVELAEVHKTQAYLSRNGLNRAYCRVSARLK